MSKQSMNKTNLGQQSGISHGSVFTQDCIKNWKANFYSFRRWRMQLCSWSINRKFINIINLQFMVVKHLKQRCGYSRFHDLRCFFPLCNSEDKTLIIVHKITNIHI